MDLIRLAMRRPISIMITIAAVIILAMLGLSRMKIDIFPDMNLPEVMVVQPYGGLSPTQMEGFITGWYEQHFFYINGIDVVESRNIQSAALITIKFRSDVNMAEALAEVVAQVERSRAYLPPGTVNPFILRFDVGNVPVGFLVFKSAQRSLGELQDLVYTRIRPIVSTLKGVTTPPPFGANQRTIVVTIDKNKLNQCSLTPEAVASTLARGNMISASGIVRVGDKQLMSTVDSTVNQIKDLGGLLLKQAPNYPNAIYLKDVAKIEDATDIDTGYALVDGKRAIFMAISKQASASTVSVVQEVKDQIDAMKAQLPGDVKVEFEFDQSKVVKDSIAGLTFEGGLGALLTGGMVLLFLQDFRSALIVIMNIPLALLSAIVALWATGQSINMMTLSGLALAVGILVDEATVMIENIHSQLSEKKPIIQAVYDASKEVAVPRLLAMLSVISVFMPSFLMTGTVRSLFVPLSLAVGFAMTASYFLSSSFVPVMCCWILGQHDDKKKTDDDHEKDDKKSKPFFEKVQDKYKGVLTKLFSLSTPVLLVYLLAAPLSLLLFFMLGKEIFPVGNPDSFQLRFKAPTGTRFEKTAEITREVVKLIKETAGDQNGKSAIGNTIAYAGTQPPSYAINLVYMWTSGPQEAVILGETAEKAKVNMAELQEKLRKKFSEKFPDVTFGFEAGDIVNKIMNFGTPTPMQIDVSGPDYPKEISFAHKLLNKLRSIDYLRDVEFTLPIDYPTIAVSIDRKRAGLMETDTRNIGLAVTEGTYSSRFPKMVLWLDHKSGFAYQVQMQIPAMQMHSLADVGSIRVKNGEGDSEMEKHKDPNLPYDSVDNGMGYEGPFIRDVASVHYASEPGEYDHINMKRTISISANMHGENLEEGEKLVRKAIEALGKPPKGIEVKVRGQIPTMHDTFNSLELGVLFAAVSIFVMLVAYFQSFKLSFAIISVMPAVILGAFFAIYITGTTLNVQSFMGTIMATGIGVANSILVVVFAEEQRRGGKNAKDAATDGAAHRLRPVLMTSLAMISGMVPMALGLGEGGERNAPLGRAVIGGLIFSTCTVLFILPLVYSLFRKDVKEESPDLLAKGKINVHEDDDKNSEAKNDDGHKHAGRKVDVKEDDKRNDDDFEKGGSE